MSEDQVELIQKSTEVDGGGTTEQKISHDIKDDIKDDNNVDINDVKPMENHVLSRKDLKDNEFDMSFIIGASIYLIWNLIMYAIATDYNDSSVQINEKDQEGGTTLQFYSLISNINTMVFVGFGFMATFLKRYGFSSVSLNLLIASLSFQWGLFVVNQISTVFGENIDVLNITTFKLADGSVAAITVIVSMGCVIGRVSPSQLLVMSFIEVLLYAINNYVNITYLKIVDIGGSILVFTFASYFGMTISWCIGEPKNKTLAKSMYYNDIFSIIGTLFLFIYWPSYNAYYAQRDYYFMERAFLNTTLSITSSVVTTFIMSKSFDGKFNIMHIQNAVLAGGVAVGASADLYIHPGGAMTTGIVSSALCIVGFEFIQPLIEKLLNIHDTCGIHNTFGLTGILGGIISCIAIGSAVNTNIYQGNALNKFPNNDLTTQAGLQFASIIVTIAIAIIGGLITGVILKIMYFDENEYNDKSNSKYSNIFIWVHSG